VHATECPFLHAVWSVVPDKTQAPFEGFSVAHQSIKDSGGGGMLPSGSISVAIWDFQEDTG
jgi:hypothetical protein